jgi:hypothetical protein
LVELVRTRNAAPPIAQAKRAMANRRSRIAESY